MFPVPFLLLLLPLLLGPGSAAAAPAVTARTLAPCFSADLRPAVGSLVSAVGCSVLLTAPVQRGSGTVLWEYRVLLQQGDDGSFYRLRTQEETTAWFHLHVLEPLSPPRIEGSSLVKAGGNTKLVCHVLDGKADAFWWKKNGEPLPESDRIQLVRNTTLYILRVSISDSGYYTCAVRNAVSHNETSFLLKVHHSANVVLPVVLACVIIGMLAGVFVWWQRKEDSCDSCW
ncbi:carcinoembryonic antigen-related cell adhesion molecule 6-like isoform X2 [Parus major]|uniref:carcinoembryonic antigen-related cell adhesion molecule 6-like isoform X2 n=1 Tax=Parus major TaxID=9157 RepID=UPI000771481E|nr:carcinoembryonic antigen-related cell adhesion molecule 6-like isoform X2 [Parus major]